MCPGHVDIPLLRDPEDSVDFSMVEKTIPMNVSQGFRIALVRLTRF